MRGGLLYSFSENFKFINSIFQKQRGKLLLRNFPLNFWDFFYSPFLCFEVRKRNYFLLLPNLDKKTKIAFENSVFS